MRALTLLATTCILSFNCTFSALAHTHNHTHNRKDFNTPLQQHLSTYRDDTHALMTLKIDLQTWKSLFDEVVEAAKPKVTVTVSKKDGEEETEDTVTSSVDNGDDLMAMFNDFNNELKEETDIDLFWDVLLNMGTHLTAGYRAFPGRAGDILFQLDVKSGKKAKEVLDKVFSTLKEDGDTTGFIRQSFGPQTLYSFVLDEKEEVYQRINLAVQDNTLLATVGPDAHQLKTMLYMGQVHPADSEFRITSVPYFNTVKNELKDTPLWTYMDLNSLIELAEIFKNEIDDLDDIAQSDIDLLAELIPISRGVGFGMNYKNKQLVFKGVAAHDTENLTPYQQAFLKRLKAPSPKKSNVKKHLLGPSPLVFVGEKLNVALDQQFPFEPQELAQSKNLSVLNEMSYRKILPQFTKLDLDQDILPYIDGNYGFSVVELPGQEVPQSVFVMGLKKGSGPAFETVLKEKFNFNVGELLSEENSENIRFTPRGKYKNTTLYSFGNVFDDTEMKGMLLPMAAQKDDVWIVGQTEAALKAALDNNTVNQPDLKKQMVKTNTRDAANAFFMDVTRLMEWAVRYGMIGKKDKDMQDFGKVFRSMYSSSSTTPDGFIGKLVLDLDLSALPFEELAEGFGEEFMGSMLDTPRIDAMAEKTPIEKADVEEAVEAAEEAAEAASDNDN